MTLPCFIGLDLGTSGCRAVAVDSTGRTLAREAVTLPEPISEPGGGRRQDALLWWRAATQVLRRLVFRLSGHHPVALAVDGTSATVLITDASGRPLAPALMYDDRRAVGPAARLADRAPPETPVHTPTSSLAKVLWLLEHVDSRKAAHVLHQAEWITARLCGRFDIGDANNCLKLGYDPVSETWPHWLTALALPDKLLPKVVTPGTVLGPLTPTASRETGLPAACQVVAGTTDSTAAALAAGLERPGDALTSLGSTLVTKVLSPKPVFHGGYGVYSHHILDRWLVGGASNSGGRVLLAHFEEEELTHLSARIHPQRPLCLDYYPLPPGTGERFPVNDPEMAPRLHPVPRDRARFLQALLEGMAAIERLAYRRLETLGAPAVGRVFTSGGGASNTAWTAIRRRVLKREILPARHGEPAWGAAFVARHALGEAAGRPLMP